jgi:hypothetical protein
MNSRIDPVSFVSSDYTKGITRVGLIGAKRLSILSERPRSPTPDRWREAHPGLQWVKIELSEVEKNACSIVEEGTEASGTGFQALNA